MARTGILTGGTNVAQITSEDLNGPQTDLLTDGVVGALTNTAGVAPATGGLAVNQNSGSDKLSAISAGIAYVTATPSSQGSQRLRVKIDAQTYTHPTNTSGGTRFDWIYVGVSPTLAANPDVSMATVGTIVVSRSTSATSDTGTPPTYGYHIATVTLANNFTVVVNGNIADVRMGVATLAANPYKFTYFRTAALTTGAGSSVTIPFDTKVFDTGSNVVSGTFTAPVAGFYQFNAQAQSGSSNTLIITSLYKNGTEYARGGQVSAPAAAQASFVSGLIQLALGDTVSVQIFTSISGALVVGSTATNIFSGFLVSRT